MTSCLTGLENVFGACRVPGTEVPARAGHPSGALAPPPLIPGRE